MYTVVVADDEYELRQSIIETVDWEKIGFKVVGEAENGVEALELVERLEPDLLLTDIKMPFISGIELARRVREIRPAMQIVFLSGYDDFQYAQQAIQYNIIKYLLKPISSKQLDEELHDIKNLMDARKKLFHNYEDTDILQLHMESFLKTILLDGMTQSVHPFHVSENLNLTAYELQLLKAQDEKPHCVALVSSFLNSDEEIITTPQHVSALNAIAQKHLSCGSFYSRGKIVSLLCGMGWEIDKYINIITTEMIQTTKRVMNQDCYIGVGNVIEGLSKAHISYNEACSAIEFGQGEKRNLSFINDIERKHNLQYEHMETVALELERRMKAGSKTDIEEYIATFFQEAKQLKVSLTDIDLLVMNVITRACTLLRSLCDDDSVQTSFARASELSAVLSKHTFDAKQKDITQFCVACKENIDKQNRMNGQVICDELRELINQEYDKEDFSLSIASERLFISASYLSALIKKTMGENFVALLTKKRMDVAKEKVLYSSMKILEIARQCGYSDQHYFSYCFKRQFGISPNKMREQEAK